MIPPPVPSAPSAVLPVEPPRGRRWSLLAGLVLGFLLALTGTGLFLLSRRGSSAPAGSQPGVPHAVTRPAVAVLDLRNLSGDQKHAWLSIAFSEMLITELSSGSQVRLVSGEEIARFRDTLSLTATEEPSAENLRRIHDLLGTDLVVVGSFLALGDTAAAKIRIDLRVLKAPEGETIASLAEVGTEEGLFDLVTTVGRKLRRSLEWADPSPEEAKATQALLPGNSEAARLYVEGLTRLRAFDSKGAQDLLEQAAEADSRSAVIHSALSLAAIGLGSDDRARQEAEKAVQLSDSLPKADRLAIEGRFAEARNDWSKASEIYRSLWTFYPDDLEFGLRLANSLSIAGWNADALAAVDSLRQLPSPLREDPRIDLVAAQIARRLGDTASELRAGQVAAEKGSRLGQTQVLAEALLLQGDALYVMGRPQESIARLRHAQSLFAKAGNKAALARALNRMGAVLLDTGDFFGAEENYRQALATARELGSRELIAAQTLALAFAAGYLGDLERSLSLAEQAHDEFTKLGEHLYETRSLFKIGENLWEMGDAEAARRSFEMVLNLARKSGNRVEEERALDGIGRVLVSSGSLGEAQIRQQQALQIARSSRDPQLSASYLACLGQTLFLQGHLSKAREYLESALESKRRVHDRLGTSQVLGMLSGLAYARGDLGPARRYASEQRALADQIRAALASAAGLQREARSDMAADDYAAAGKRLLEALRLSSSQGAALLATGLRVDQARLALLERRPGEAVPLATAAADWYGQRGMAVERARALGLLSQALLADGRPVEAREAADQAHSIAQESEDLELRLEVATAAGARP